MRKHIFTGLGVAAVAAVLVLAGTTVDAQRGTPRGDNGADGRGPAVAARAARDGGPARGMRGGQAGRGGGPIAAFGRLDLTDDQREVIEDIVSDQRDTAAPMVDELRLAEANLRRAIFADTPDSGAVETLAAQVSDLRTKIAESRLETQLAVAAQLTPEQRETARNAPGRGGRGRANGPRPGPRG